MPISEVHPEEPRRGVQSTYHQLYMGVATALTSRVRKTRPTQLKPGKEVQSTGKAQHASPDLAGCSPGPSPSPPWASVLPAPHGGVGWDGLQGHFLLWSFLSY